MPHPLAIGIDLGATKIASALVTRDGHVLASRQTPTLASEGPSAVCDRIAAEILSLLSQSPTPPIAIGIGSPGIVDSSTGTVRQPINLGWDTLPLAAEIQRRLPSPLPVHVENDANVNALGEGLFGSAKGSEHYVLLTVGSGLGAGVVSHGQLLTGAHSIATDLGHYSLDPDHGLPCPCGHRGCAETLVCGPGLLNLTRSLLAQSPSPTLSPDDSLTTDRILSAARAHDPVATAAFTTIARALGHVAAVAAAVTNPDTVIIGGGLGTASFDLLLPHLSPELHRRLPPTYANTITLKPATLPTPALGAAALAWSHST